VKRNSSDLSNATNSTALHWLGQSFHGALRAFCFGFLPGFLQISQTSFTPLICFVPIFDATAERFLEDSGPNAVCKCEPWIACPTRLKSMLATAHVMQRHRSLFHPKCWPKWLLEFFHPQGASVAEAQPNGVAKLRFCCAKWKCWSTWKRQ
jgi:hypothetical protein